MGTPNPGTRVDAARAVVLPGSGAAIRLPGLLCLLRPSADEEGTPGLGQLARLVEILTENSAAHPATPGRPLARRLARWLGSLDPGPDFGTVAATESGIAIFLHGGVDAVVGGQRHSARDSGAWLDRLLDYPPGPLVLVPSDEPAPDNSPRAVFDLRGGVVPGGTVLLVPRSGTLPSVLATPSAAPEEAAPAPADTAGEARDGGAAPVPAAAGDPERTPPAPFPAKAGRHARVSPILGFGPDEPPRAPLDAGVPGEPPRAPLDAGVPAHRAPGTAVAAAPDAPPATNGATRDVPMAAGFRCARDHLNDPRNHFCVVCGIRMNERTGVVEVGPRPPLGLLVFDDGSTYTLDADYLLGRMPESDPRVVGGELRPLPVEDPEAQLSRGHLVIRLDGWDVTAIDESTNGTLVAHASDRAWSRLTPRTPLRLLPGTRVRVGGRSFVFESPSGVR